MRTKRIIFSVLTVLLVSGYLHVCMCGEGLAKATESNKTFIYETAGVSFELPAGWNQDKGEGLYFSEHAIIEVRIRNRTFDTLDSEIIDIDKFNEKMAHSVKENQYYVLLEKNPFTSKNNTTGIRCIYGYSPDSPSQISYYLIKNKVLIEIELKFRTWETKEIWRDLDTLILNTIKLQP